MKEKLISELGDSLNEIGVVIDDVYTEKEGHDEYLRVVLDRDEIIDIDTVVKATKIIDPIIEKLELVKGEYILDVYAKQKGDN